MKVLRRLFEDPNRKTACTECRAEILNRTARETGGFCKPCHRLGPEGRAARAAFEARLADGGIYQLTEEERASTRRMDKNVPDPARWFAHPEDLPHESYKEVRALAASLKSGSLPALYLRNAGESSLIVETKGDLAAIWLWTEEGGQFLHGPMATTGQVPAEDQIWLTCPCCGQGSFCVPSRFHLPRKAALAALDHILTGHAAAHMYWVRTDLPDRTAPGRG